MTEEDQVIRKKIKALLAKAESSEFQEESDAFYAKAAELMARHAVEEADLADPEAKPIIERREYVVPSPYSMDRMFLVSAVAESLGGYAYYMKQRRDGYKTRNNVRDHNTYAFIMGMPSDVDQIVTMLDSLNRQMEHARQRDQARAGGSMGRKKVWNATYIRAYSQRIKQRMKEAYDAVIQETTGSTAMVLRNKEAMLVEELQKIGVQTQRSARQADAGAIGAGRAAADRASIYKELQ